VLPTVTDPDEFIRKYGLIEYPKQRGEAQPHIQFVIDQAVAQSKICTATEKADAVEEVLPYIRRCAQPDSEARVFDIAMDSLRISDAALRLELFIR